jgi:nicotinamidase-related amidase
MTFSKAVAFVGLLALSPLLPGLQGAASAQTIVDQWTSVKRPPAPVLKSVTVDPKTTALLVLDFVPKTCGPKPRCLASLPKIAAFLKQARAHKMPVVYSVTLGATTADIYKQIAPLPSEPYVAAHADKFIGTDLEKMLKGMHVTTIIPVGVTAEGAVLYTASHAAFLGFKVIDPVDGSSAGSAYAELATAWVLSNAPTVGQQTTLTSFDKIGW